MILAAVAAACGPNEPERTPGDRLREVLSHSVDSTVTVPLLIGDTVTISSQTLAFYRRVRFQAAWSEMKEPGEMARALHAAIAASEQDGLSPERYRHDVAGRVLEAFEAEDEKGKPKLDRAERADWLADLDLLLSEGYMRYATDVVMGTIAPEDVGRAWRIARSGPPSHVVLRSVARGGDPQQIVQRLRPSTPHYARLMSALQRLREVREGGGWEPVPGDSAVAEGDSSATVAALRRRLLTSDDPREAALAQRNAARPDVFDRDLRDALRHYQARHALDDDGRLGRATARELNHTVDERIAELKLNLDRWRWLPSQLGDLFVLVNIAGFELEVVEHNRAIEAMNVVVGTTGWKTPVFADTIEHVVLNPYWTPTENILKDEILPAIERDPGYLARNGFERTANGRIRQKPGGRNALGRYKFLFPNDDDIYLHDTPADHLFSRTRRDFSHGCVRLERPADLARLLVGRASNHSPAAIDGMVATGAEKWLTLKRPIPIYIVYFTAWVKEDGTLRFHHDVYGHDEDLEQQRQDLLVEPAQRVVAAVSAGE